MNAPFSRREPVDHNHKTLPELSSTTALMALEPRYLFDAAALATGGEVLLDQVAAQQAADVLSGDDAPGGAAPVPLSSTDSDELALILGSGSERSDEIIFVDTSVEDYEILLAGLDSRAEVILIDGARDGIEQIAEALKGRTDIAALSLISHGSAGELRLGTGVLNATTMRGAYADELAVINQALTESGDILILGCDFAKGQKGLEATRLLSDLTGADIAASDDLTGAARLGGDWDLEVRTGDIEADLNLDAMALEAWDHTLAPLEIDISGATLTTGTNAAGEDFGLYVNGGSSSDAGGPFNVDIMITVKSGTTPIFTTTGNDIRIVSMSAGTFVLSWEFFRSGTNQAMAATGSPTISIADLDGISPGNPIETVSATQDGGLTSYTVANPTSLAVTVANGRVTGAGGNQVNPADRPDAAIQFNFGEVTAVEFTYTTLTGGRFFNHDGNGEFDFGGNPQSFNLPVGAFDTVTLNEDTPTALNPTLPTDADQDDATLGIVVISVPPAAQGTLSYAPAGGGPAVPVTPLLALTPAELATVVFTPALNFNGPVDPFQYEVTDNTGQTAPGQVAITVTPVNDLPVVDSGAITVNEESTDTPLGLAAPTDVDGDMLTITVTRLPALGTVTLANGTPVANGQILTIAQLTGLQFDAPADYDGVADPGDFTYDVFDGTATVGGAVDITINPVNDPPVAVDDGPVTVIEDIPASGNVLSNDTDVDGDPLIVTGFTIAGLAGSFNPGDIAVIPGVGTLTIAANGAFTFTPAANFFGPVPTATYTISDGNGGTDMADLSFNDIADANEVPMAVDDTNSTDEDTAISITAANGLIDPNDTDPDGDTLNVTEVNGVAGSVGNQIILASGALLTVNADGSYDYDPNGAFENLGAGDTALETFTYTVSDGNGGTDTASVSITINGVNDPPVAVNDMLTTPEDTPVTFDPVGANDTDVDGDPLTNTEINGMPIIAGDPAGVTVTGGVITLAADGVTLTFTPDPGFNGPADFTYTIDDGNGGTDTATVDLNVTPVNDPPVANDDGPVTVTEDTPASGNVLSNDTDAEGDPLTVTGFTIAGLAGSFNPGDVATIPGVGALTIAANGAFTFTPAANYFGPVPTATYTISDGNGGTDMADLSFNDIVNVKDPPVAVDDMVTTTEDTPVTFDPVGANDTDADGDPLTITEINGIPIVAGDPIGVSVTGGVVTLAADGVTLTFTPDPDFNGPADFTYTIDDGNGGADTATIDLDVTPANDPPGVDGAILDQLNLDGETISPLDISGAFSDPDGDPLTFTATGLPPGLSLDPVTGLITGTLPADASINGPYTVTITATDPDGLPVQQVFIWTVDNIPPEVVSPLPGVIIAADTPVSTPTAASFNDPDGDPLTFTAVGLPPGLAIDPVTGLITGMITQDTADTGPFTIQVTVTDTSGASVSSDFALTVGEIVAVVGDPGSLLLIGQPISKSFTEPMDSPEPSLDAEGAVLKAVLGIGDLGSTETLTANGPVSGVVNAARFLNGGPELGSDDGIVLEVTDQKLLQDLTDRIEARFGIPGGIGVPDGLTGFSLRMNVHTDASDGSADHAGQIIVETLVRDRVLYVGIVDTLDADRISPIVEYRATLADGRALPRWLRMASNGLLIGEWPANVEHIPLRIMAIQSDGGLIVRTVSISLPSGEIRLVVGEDQRAAADLFSAEIAYNINLTVESSSELVSALGT